MIITLPGLRPGNLMTYLAGLGVVRIVGTQLDPEATSWWQGQILNLDTAADDLMSFFLDAYRPTPALSPWNSGSGYGDKDKAQKVALQRLLTSHSPRLADFVATDAAFDRVPPDEDKGRYLQRLRNVVPDSALAWIDASVVLTVDRAKGVIRPVFPPLLGTGGNDGRFDFSTHFHQRLADVIPELGADRRRSKSWLQAAFNGLPSPLLPATIGQFDPLAAGGPGTSTFGDSASLANPWNFVLMVEGLMLFASAPVRRYGEASSRAAQPFTVNASPGGPIPGAEGEGSRGELWAPLWDRPLGSREVGHLFASARTSWNGRTATAAAHMYAALHSNGIDRRADRFVRYGLYQRNGLAYTAVRLDTVTVAQEPQIELGIAIERRTRAFLAVPRTNRVEPVLRRYEDARVGFYRDPDARTLLAFLAAATAVEQATTVTAAGRDEVGVSADRLHAARALPLLRPVLAQIPEYRIAVGLASGAVHLDTGWASMADLLVGRAPMRTSEAFRGAVVDGFGQRSLPAILSGLMQWRATHRRQDGPSTAGFAPMDRWSVRTPWQDAHLWAQRRLDENLIQRGLEAMLSLGWSKDGVTLSDGSRNPAPRALPAPDLAILQPFAQRYVTVGSADDADRRGIQPAWPGLIASGRQGEVLTQAVTVLNRSSIIVKRGGGMTAARPRSRARTPVPTTDPHHLAAALWLPVNPIHALGRIIRLEDVPPTDQEVAS